MKLKSIQALLMMMFLPSEIFLEILQLPEVHQVTGLQEDQDLEEVGRLILFFFVIYFHFYTEQYSNKN